MIEKALKIVVLFVLVLTFSLLTGCGGDGDGDDEGDISSEDRNVAIVLDSTIPSNGTTGEDRFEG